MAVGRREKALNAGWVHKEEEEKRVDEIEMGGRWRIMVSPHNAK